MHSTHATGRVRSAATKQSDTGDEASMKPQHQANARLQHAQTVQYIRGVLGDRCRKSYGNHTGYRPGDWSRLPHIGTPRACHARRAQDCCAVSGASSDASMVAIGPYSGPDDYTPSLPGYCVRPPDAQDKHARDRHAPLAAYLRDSLT